jgi:hypothetical protein
MNPVSNGEANTIVKIVVTNKRNVRLVLGGDQTEIEMLVFLVVVHDSNHTKYHFDVFHVGILGIDE